MSSLHQRCKAQRLRRSLHLFNPFSTTPYRLPFSAATASSAPTAASAAAHISTKTTSQVKNTKLKKWFSGKNFTVNAPATRAAACSAGGGGGSCRSRGREMRRRSSKINNADGNQVRVNINELDPPLPVIKKLPVQPSEVNLWRRRSGGVALKSLQIQQQIHLPNDCNTTYQPAPTV